MGAVTIINLYPYLVDTKGNKRILNKKNIKHNKKKKIKNLSYNRNKKPFKKELKLRNQKGVVMA